MNNKLCDQSITNLFINHQKMQQSALNKFVTSNSQSTVFKIMSGKVGNFIKKVGLQGLHFLRLIFLYLVENQMINFNLLPNIRFLCKPTFGVWNEPWDAQSSAIGYPEQIWIYL